LQVLFGARGVHKSVCTCGGVWLLRVRAVRSCS
jgi:hypothetical protein